MTKNRNFTGRRLQQSFEDFNGRGLPGTIGAKQAEAFSSFNFEVQAADRFYFSVVGLAQVMTLNGNWHREILP